MPKRRVRSSTSLPMNSSCFLCNIEIPGDSKDLFEHFRSVHFITTEPPKENPPFEQNQTQQHCHDLEELTFSDIAMECDIDLPLDNDVSRWTSEDVARKLRMEGFDLLVVERFRDEDIDGPSLMTLTREDLNELKLKLGHKKKMERLIQTLQKPAVVQEPPLTPAPPAQPAQHSQPPSNATTESFSVMVQHPIYTTSHSIQESSSNIAESLVNIPESQANVAVSPTNISVSPTTIPIYSTIAPVSSAIAPVSTAIPPASTAIAPVCSAIAPVSSTVVPVLSVTVPPSQEFVSIQQQPTVISKVHMQQLPNIDSSSSPQRSEKTMFNVTEMVLASSKGRTVYEEYLARDKAFLTVPERRTIVCVVVEAMVNEHGLYPTTQEKDMLAAAIIQAFPCLGIRDGNNLIHSHYYHAKSGGFIETLLKTLRKKQPECRKRKISMKQKIHRKIPRGFIDEVGPELEAEEIQMHEFMVRLLKSLIPTPSNAEQINDAMESTYPFRQYQMKRNLKTPGLVLAEYPRMMDFNNGLLIYDDFRRKYPMAGEIEQSFVEPYADRLIRLAEKELESLPFCNNEFLRLLLICILVMPEIKKIRKNSTDEKIHQLVIFVSENRNLQELVALRSRDQTKSSHPYLVGVGTMSDPVYFNLVIDGNIIPCGDDSVTAFKNLFASYFVFQLHYPVLIKPLLKFFEERVFRLTPTMTATTADFVARLESIPR